MRFYADGRWPELRWVLVGVAANTHGKPASSSGMITELVTNALTRGADQGAEGTLVVRLGLFRALYEWV